jgi:hypothetical protein
MKSLLFLPIAVLCILFSNCTKKEYVQPNQTIFTTLKANNWKFDAGSNTYYNEVSMPEIDDLVAQNNGVLAYITYDNKVYEALPDVLDGSTFIYRYQAGFLDVELQNSDGSTTSLAPPTNDIGLKIVLINSATQ